MATNEERVDDLSRALMQMSGVLFSEETVQSALDRICSLAHETIPRAAGAGVTLVRERNKVTAAYSKDDLVLRADELQYELNEGPCLSAYRDKVAYRIDSMPDERWPRWSAAAAGMGIGSSISIPLLVRDQAIGAMKVYAAQVNHFADRDERILMMLAEQAGIVLSNVLEYSDAKATIAQLKEAIETRDAIGMAKGILIERERVGEEGAFNMLRVASQNQNIKLRDIARALVDEATRRERS